MQPAITKADLRRAYGITGNTLRAWMERARQNDTFAAAFPEAYKQDKTLTPAQLIVFLRHFGEPPNLLPELEKYVEKYT